MKRYLDRVRAGLYAIRVWLAKAIDPGPAPDEQFDLFIRTPLRCAAALRDHTHIDETSYLRVAGQAHADPRAYVVYTALDEVQKTSMWLVRIRELIQGEAINPFDGSMERLLHTHLIEERDGRIRRLLEVLVTLVHFAETNEQTYYRHLLALEVLDSEISAQTDVREFWAAPSNNLAWSVARQIELIKHCEEEVELARCWYLRERARLTDAAARNPGRLLSSMRSRIRDALPLMRDREKLLFGFTYGASYGRTSESMHYSPDRGDFDAIHDDDLTARSHLMLLSVEVLVRCHQLLGSPSVPVLDQLTRALERTEGNALFKRATSRQIAVGDFVLVHGELGEVLEMIESRYGYRSYRVRYLAERPIAGIDEDWFPALYVQRLYTKEEFFRQMHDMVRAGTLPEDLENGMRKLSEPELQRILGASISEVWKLGLRNWMRQQASERRAQDNRRGPA